MKRIFAGLMVVVMVLVLFAGCGKAKTEETTELKPDSILIDAERNYDGGLDIYIEGKGFDHWYDVTDYVKGDPAGIAAINGLDPICGIFAVLEAGSDEVVNMAIFENGVIAHIDTQYKLLPRAGYGQPYVFHETDDGASMTLTLNANSDDYSLSIKGVNQSPVEVDGVDDAWPAYDTVYWLVGDTVYSLNWLRSDAEPEVYFKGANAVSHHSDESEGALVPLDKANYEAYGRSDIFSPYGITN